MQVLSYDVDASGHGTHMAGTIAAVPGNRFGVAGINSIGTPLHIIRLFNSTSDFAYASSVLDAGLRCREAGARVINLSLGGKEPVSAECDGWAALAASNEASVLPVAAAGQ